MNFTAILSRVLSVFDGVQENSDPVEWRKHLFGLSKERWDTLAGKSFWVTGAGTGYGRSIAAVLAAANAKVLITGRRVAKLEETVAEAESILGASKSSFVLLPADITNSYEMESLFFRLHDSLSSPLHGLINGAAVPERQISGYPLQDGDEMFWDVMMNTNVKAQWLIARSALPYMLSANQARVVFLSSGAGWADTPGFGMYNVSKAALNSLACSLAAESSARHPDADIQINVVDPGEARTEMNDGSKVSPYSAVSVVLFLLSRSGKGPNGRFFRRNGFRIQCGSSRPYLKRL